MSLGPISHFNYFHWPSLCLQTWCFCSGEFPKCRFDHIISMKVSWLCRCGWVRNWRLGDNTRKSKGSKSYDTEMLPYIPLTSGMFLGWWIFFYIVACMVSLCIVWGWGRQALWMNTISCGKLTRFDAGFLEGNLNQIYNWGLTLLCLVSFHFNLRRRFWSWPIYFANSVETTNVRHGNQVSWYDAICG